MVKSELCLEMALEMDGISLGKMEGAVNSIIDLMGETLAGGDRIEIRGFGSFHTMSTRDKIGRNPLSGEAVHIPSHPKVKFKAGLDMRARVNASQGNDLSSTKFKTLKQLKNLK